MDEKWEDEQYSVCILLKSGAINLFGIGQCFYCVFWFLIAVWSIKRIIAFCTISSLSIFNIHKNPFIMVLYCRISLCFIVHE